MSPEGAGRPGRPCCPRCALPQAACLCHWVRPTAHHTRVALWQHPQEVAQAKNSARLLSLSLADCAVHAPPELSAALPPAWLAPGAVLLYPAESADPARGAAAPPSPSPLGDAPWPQGRLPHTLVALDGTWRQSRQMLRLQPALRALPRLALPPEVWAAHGARYRVRKAHRPGQLSTLEAVLLALRHLEGNATLGEPLMQAFDGWMDELLARAGRV